MNVLELFPCSGGMAEGLRRAGIEITMAFDHDADACVSYAQNLGHAPVRMDVRHMLRMAEAGWRPPPIDLLVADPPCTPWSRAGKRKGQEDARDLIDETVELVRLLEPFARPSPSGPTRRAWSGVVGRSRTAAGAASSSSRRPSTCSRSWGTSCAAAPTRGRRWLAAGASRYRPPTAG